jgi:hypothetical protein
MPGDGEKSGIKRGSERGEPSQAGESSESSSRTDQYDIPEPREGHAHNAALDIVPRSDVTHRAVSDGPWSDPATWEDNVPEDEARVHIPEETVVTVDETTEARLKTVRVDGVLRFDPTVDTSLQVETLVTTPGSVFTIGTDSQPVNADASARVTFVDHGPIDESQDPERVGKGLITMGTTEIVGAEKSSWHELSIHPRSGDARVVLEEEPTGWSAGDEVVVPGLSPDENQDEEAIIERVNGRVVFLDRELSFDHVPPEADLPTYVLNLDRNVRLASENETVARRGHTMFMTVATKIRYAKFDELGRTDKSYPFTNGIHGEPPEDVPPNPKARYALHFHKTGIDADLAHEVEGVAVHGSPGWGVVNHKSLAHVTDSVTYQVFGSGFVAENGIERGSFRRNFALRSEGSGEFTDSRSFNTRVSPQNVDDFGHGGHGFWFQGPLLDIEDNVAAGHRYYGFVFWNRPLIERELDSDEEMLAIGPTPNLPVSHVEGQEPLKNSRWAQNGKLPSAFVKIANFSGNVSFASAGGVDISRQMVIWFHQRQSEWGTIDDFVAYNIGALLKENGMPHGLLGRGSQKGNSAITIRYSTNITIKDSRLVSGQGRDGIGINRNTGGRNISVENCSISGFEMGIRAPVRQYFRCINSELGNSQDILINEKVERDGRNIRLRDLEFQDENSDSIVMSVEDYEDMSFRELLSTTDSITLDGDHVFFNEQDPNFTPIPNTDSYQKLKGEEWAEQSVGGSPERLIGKTNNELEEFDLAVFGSETPPDSQSDEWVSGGQMVSDDEIDEIWIEAEQATGENAWDIESNEDTTTGECIIAQSAENMGAPPESGYVTHEFEAEGGHYDVYLRADARDWDRNSVWFRIDDGEWKKWTMTPTSRGWEWRSLSENRYERDSVSGIDLSEGSHNLQIAVRKDGLMIDKVLLTTLSRPPFGLGR